LTSRATGLTTGGRRRGEMFDIYTNDDEALDYDQDEVQPDYDAINDEQSLAEWEASLPVMVICDDGILEPF
jgi:hypothetical protein